MNILCPWYDKVACCWFTNLFLHQRLPQSQIPSLVFPDPSKYAQFHKLDHVTLIKVCHWFKLVCEDLENALIKEVQLWILSIVKMTEEPESDFRGLSDAGYKKNKEGLEAIRNISPLNMVHES
jgi:hypothetical protein